jgi:hypothetical protein
MFTRGQLEWAIAQAIGRSEGLGNRPRGDLKMKLKRLLDIDRKHGIDAAKPGPEFRRFAFLEGGLPGKGFAISYTGYDAFALLLGLQLLEANVPQLAVIRLLRSIRPNLQHEHKQVLLHLPRLLAGGNIKLENKINAGQMVKDPAKMVFVVISSGAGADILSVAGQDDSPANIVRSPEKLVSMVAHLTRVSPPVLVFELVNSALQLAYWLNRAPSIRRGRP